MVENNMPPTIAVHAWKPEINGFSDFPRSMLSAKYACRDVIFLAKITVVTYCNNVYLR